MSVMNSLNPGFPSFVINHFKGEHPIKKEPTFKRHHLEDTTSHTVSTHRRDQEILSVDTLDLNIVGF